MQRGIIMLGIDKLNWNLNRKGDELSGSRELYSSISYR